MPTLMNRAQYAAHRHVVPTAVSKWKARGLIVMAEDPQHPGKFLIDAEASDALVKRTVDITTGRPRNDETPVAEVQQLEMRGLPQPTAKAPVSEMEIARLENLRERTIRQQLDRATLMGQLVPISEFTARAGDMGRRIRERSHFLIRQNAERLAAETEPRKIAAFLSEAFDNLFTQVAEDIEREADEELRADIELANSEADDMTQDELEFEEPQ